MAKKFKVKPGSNNTAKIGKDGNNKGKIGSENIVVGSYVALSNNHLNNIP